MTKDINTQLYEKVQREYKEFREALTKMPPVKIMERAYEKVFKEEISLSLLGCDFPYHEAKALMNCKNTLDTLYIHWLNSEYSYNEMLDTDINDCASELGDKLIFKERLARDEI